MGAVFTRAAVYWVEAVCQSPIRTGGADGDTERVLRHRDGTPFIQGTSLAGALRSWLKASALCDRVDALFGDQKKSGHLIVSDAEFEKSAEAAVQYLRPRVRIDGGCAAAADGVKFDVAHIGRGARFHFTLTWLDAGGAEDQGELDAISAMLSALHSGEITLGAQKSNGFGRVSLSVQRRRLDMRDPDSRNTWLEWDGFAALPDSEPLILPDVPSAARTVFTVFGRCGSILVKSGVTSYEAAEDSSDEGTQYTPNISEGGRPVLPGSSIKGAVRARAAAIAGLLGLRQSFVDRLFGRGAEEGDNGLPGRVHFSEVLLPEPPEKRRKISRIRIDRFTGSVIRQGLFNEEPVCAGTFSIHITAPEDDAARSLLLYALRDLGLGLYSLGSGQAIGRGYVEVDRIRAVTSDQKEASLHFCERDGSRAVERLEDPEGVFVQWTDALKEARCED